MGGPGGMANRPLPVQAQATRRGDMAVTINALGTVSALNTAIVKARVAGQLQRIAFREGQLVKQGDLLAEIDPRPFQAQLDQAAGQLARDEALLANARADLERYRNLLKKDSIASQQVDNQDWLVRQYEGTVKNDRGIVADAKLQLDFSRVTAPFSGRLGLRQVDVGNYVQTGDANGIVVITQTQPINVVFAIPADALPAVLAHLHAGEPLPVDAYDRAGATRLATGKVASIDNQMDVATGTVKLKAEFANSDEKLFPNQFVNARLHVDTRHDVVLAPTAAIQRGARGLFMYVIGADKTVHVRAVTPGPTSHDSIVIENGLREGELVVIDGADKLRDGAKVEISQPGAGKAPANAPGGHAARQSAQ
jgi:multidrug efflux system membrane fusion protein